MRGLYNSDGYVDFDYIYNIPTCFILLMGGRCTGKTYGALSYMLDNKIKFAYMRRTQAQIDISSQDETSIFKSINNDKGYNVLSKAIKNQYAYYNADDDGKIGGEPIGYGFALSTISNVRGFGMQDITTCIYDEFIPELHEKSMKGEFDAFLNAYSTINRNRELNGRPPLKMICMGNSNNINNSILIGLNLVEVVEKMKRNGKEMLSIKHRDITIILLDNSPIAKRLKNTALARISAGTNFSEMAFENNFAYNYDDNILSNIVYNEYLPKIRIGNKITILQHKSKGTVLASTKLFDCKLYYDDNDTGYKQFCTQNPKLVMLYYMGKILYNSAGAEYHLKQAIKWR